MEISFFVLRKNSERTLRKNSDFFFKKTKQNKKIHKEKCHQQKAKTKITKKT